MFLWRNLNPGNVWALGRLFRPAEPENRALAGVERKAEKPEPSPAPAAGTSVRR